MALDNDLSFVTSHNASAGGSDHEGDENNKRQNAGIEKEIFGMNEKKKVPLHVQ